MLMLGIGMLMLGICHMKHDNEKGKPCMEGKTWIQCSDVYTYPILGIYSWNCAKVYVLSREKRDIAGYNNITHTLKKRAMSRFFVIKRTL